MKTNRDQQSKLLLPIYVPISPRTTRNKAHLHLENNPNPPHTPIRGPVEVWKEKRKVISRCMQVRMGGASPTETPCPERGQASTAIVFRVHATSARAIRRAMLYLFDPARLNAGSAVVTKADGSLWHDDTMHIKYLNDRPLESRTC